MKTTRSLALLLLLLFFFLLATQLERYELLLGLESALGKFENFYSASPAPFFWEGLEGLLLAAKPRLAAAANYFKIF